MDIGDRVWIRSHAFLNERSIEDEEMDKPSVRVPERVAGNVMIRGMNSG